jgi:hypothetical protein
LERLFQKMPIAVKIAVFSVRKKVFASERRALTSFRAKGRHSPIRRLAPRRITGFRASRRNAF